MIKKKNNSTINKFHIRHKDNFLFRGFHTHKFVYDKKGIKLYKYLPTNRNKKLLKCKHFNSFKGITHKFIDIPSEGKNKLTNEISNTRHRLKTLTSSGSKDTSKNFLKTLKKGTKIHRKDISLSKESFTKLDKKELKFLKKDVDKKLFFSEINSTSDNTCYDGETCEEWSHEHDDNETETSVELLYDSYKDG